MLIMVEALHGGQGGFENSVVSTQFCYESQTALKNEIFLKGKINKGNDDFFKNFKDLKDKERLEML